jgi:cytoskeleton-associated protein 5
MLIERNGLNVFNPAKSMPGIAVHISDRDAAVRNAALNAVANAYAVLGESLYKYIGNISDKDKSLLEERIKRRKDINIGNPPVSRTGPVSVPPKSPGSPARVQPIISASNSRKFSLDLENLNLPELSATDDKLQGFVPKRVSEVAKSKDFMMDVLFTQITSGDAFQSIEALKTLEKYIQTQPEIILGQLNHMVNSITLQVRLAFTSPILFGPEPATLLRLCKHLVNVLVQMFSNKPLAAELSRDTMHQLLSELLARLIDPSLQQKLGEHGGQLVRALNVLMLRILENCDKNRVFRYLREIHNILLFSQNQPVFCWIYWTIV